MKKLLTLFVTFSILFQFTSCKDEEVSPVIISFSSQTSTVSEGAGTAIVSIVLDKGATGDIVIDFTITGSAEAGVDYESSGSMTILNGAMDGQLSIDIIDDDTFEFDAEVLTVFGEKLDITISSVTGNALLSEEVVALTHSLVIEENDEEPYLLIELSWEDKATGDAGDVDMDLLFWFETTPGSNEFQFGPQSLQLGTSIGTEFEFLTLSGITPDTNYGLTFLYFAGTATDLEFTVKFTAFGGATLLNGLTEAIYVGSYTEANINEDAFEVGDFQIEQSYSKVKYDYPSISELTIPSEGSRTKQPKLIIPDGISLKDYKK